jgi:hypothetical protein
MPVYKILGIFSFSENLKKVKLNDSVVLKNESFNIKSKNAIGVYCNEKKIGYLPVESKNEVNIYNNSYKISKLSLHETYPVVEINRFFPNINILENVEYPYEKQIKYSYKPIKITDERKKDIIHLEKYLLTKRIKTKRIAIIYEDDYFINILIETAKCIQQFQCITSKYFNENNDIYEELYENELINNTFFRLLHFYRLECYIENNYNSILDSLPVQNNDLLKMIQTIKEIKIHDELIINDKKIDILLLIKLYLRYKINNNKYYLNKTGFDINTIIPNYILLDIFIDKYNIKLGNFIYDHKLKIYSYIDFINDDTVFIIDTTFKTNYLYNIYLTNKNNLIVYNPLIGNIIYLYKDIQSTIEINQAINDLNEQVNIEKNLLLKINLI